MENGDGINLGLSDKTGALMMINKKERKILREILGMTLKSEGGRAYIETKFGSEYLEIADNLLECLED
jgi:hypothetical protein